MEAELSDGSLEVVIETDGIQTDDGQAAEHALNVLYDLELDATLQFGSREVPLREVLELGPGDVVELNRHVSEPVDLVVGDRIIARGEVVVVSGNFALRITEVATPQMRLESIRCLF
jgi:flagellar motor switch protein FliN/FliY